MKKKTNKVVKDLPDGFVEIFALENGWIGTVENVAFSREDQLAVADIGGGEWTVLPVGRDIGGYSPFGAIGGYNISAPVVGRLLALLGFWSEEEADSFGVWYWEETRRRTAKYEINRHKEALERAGYTVSKKKSS